MHQYHFFLQSDQAISRFLQYTDIIFIMDIYNKIASYSSPENICEYFYVLKFKKRPRKILFMDSRESVFLQQWR